MNKRRKAALLTSAAAVTAALTGCSTYTQEHAHNTPIGGYKKPRNVVIQFPYKFDNVARACVDGDGIYVAFRGTTPTVVPNDPACSAK